MCVCVCVSLSLTISLSLSLSLSFSLSLNILDELQMLDEGMSRPRRPILASQTFRSVVGIKGNEFVLKYAFVGVTNDLYVFVVVMKLRHEVSNALLNNLSLRVVIEEYCI